MKVLGLLAATERRKDVRPSTRLPLKEINKENSTKSISEYMSIDFPSITLTDECLTTVTRTDAGNKESPGEYS